MNKPTFSEKPLYSTDISRMHKKKFAPAGCIYVKVTFRYLQGFHTYVRTIKQGTLPAETEERKEYFDAFYRKAYEDCKIALTPKKEVENA